MTPTRLRATLAEATRDLHHRLDAQAGAFGAADAAPGPAYLRYLLASHAFRSRVDPALGRLSAAGQMPGWQPLPLIAALETDLRDLALMAPPARPRPWPLPGDAAGAAGLLYVVEGASLGARVLARRAAALGLGPAQGARHLAAQTADPQRWPRFLAWLEAGAFAPGPAIEAARAAFALALACHDPAAGTAAPAPTFLRAVPRTP